MNGKLIIIGSPIGSHLDVSQRMIEAVTKSKFIAVENITLFKQFVNDLYVECTAELIEIAYEVDDDKEIRNYPYILDLLLSGNDVYVISDEGMPGIADPGHKLIDLIIAEGHDINITSSPGPSTVMAAVAVAGCLTRFSFEGFLSHNKEERIMHLNRIKDHGIPQVFFLMNQERTMLPNEPFKFSNQILEFLDEAIDAYGQDKKSTLCYNLTLPNELVVRKTLGQLRDHLLSNERVSGNFCLVVH